MTVAGQVPVVQVKNLIADVGDALTNILEQMVADGENNITVPVPGLGTLFASKVEDMSRYISNGPVDIFLPETFITSVVSAKSPIPGDSLVFSATTVEEGAAKRLGAFAVVVLDLSWLKSGGDFSVSGLAEPVQIKLPVINNVSGLTCAYWDEEVEGWSTEGVSVSPNSKPGEMLLCETTHFSLFGAILEGMLNTFLCANFNIFTTENLRQVFTGDWHTSLGAWLLYGIAGSLLMLFVKAAVVDCYRRRRYRWNDEFFLVSIEPRPLDRGETIEELPELPKDGLCKRFILMVFAALLTVTCCSGDALREALDDIISTWFEHFSVLREVLEQLCGDVSDVIHAPEYSFAALLGVLIRTSERTARKLLLANSRRRAAATLGISPDLVTFVLEDKDFAAFLTDEMQEQRARRRESMNTQEFSGIRRVRKPTAPESNPQAEPSSADSSSSPTLSSSPTAETNSPSLRAASRQMNSAQFEAWSQLRQEVNEEMLARTCRRHSKCKVLTGMIHDLLWHNPIANVFAMDIHNSCKEKVAILAAELLGSFVFCAIFFQGGGMVKPKAGKKRGGSDPCDSGEEETFGMRIGRFLAIAIASLVIAGAPVGVLDSLLVKGFKKVEGVRGSTAWQKQLKAWQYQRALFWSFATAYISLCLAYLLVFIANTDPSGHQDYSLAGAISLCQDLLAFPAFVALGVPLLGKAWITAHAWAMGHTWEDFVRRACVSLREETNMMLPIEQV